MGSLGGLEMCPALWALRTGVKVPDPAEIGSDSCGVRVRDHVRTRSCSAFGESEGQCRPPAGPLWLHPGRCQVAHSPGSLVLESADKERPRGRGRIPPAPRARSPFFRFLCPSFFAFPLLFPPSIQYPSFFLILLSAHPSPPRPPSALALGLMLPSAPLLPWPFFPRFLLVRRREPSHSHPPHNKGRGGTYGWPPRCQIHRCRTLGGICGLCAWAGVSFPASLRGCPGGQAEIKQPQPPGRLRGACRLLVLFRSRWEARSRRPCSSRDSTHASLLPDTEIPSPEDWGMGMELQGTERPTQLLSLPDTRPGLASSPQVAGQPSSLLLV